MTGKNADVAPQSCRYAVTISMVLRLSVSVGAGGVGSQSSCLVMFKLLMCNVISAKHHRRRRITPLEEVTFVRKSSTPTQSSRRHLRPPADGAGVLSRVGRGQPRGRGSWSCWGAGVVAEQDKGTLAMGVTGGGGTIREVAGRVWLRCWV